MVGPSLQITSKVRKIINPEHNGLPNKCSIILINNPDDDKTEDILKVVDRITGTIHQIPSFMLVLSDSLKIASTKLEMPIFSLRQNSNILRFRCAGSTESTRITVGSLRKLKFKDYCSLRGKVLRIAYNNVSPYFQVNADQMDPNSLECLYLQTFISKHRLIPELKFAGMTWGARDGSTGVWNGVVGMVGYGQSDLGVTAMSYNAERAEFIDYTHQLGIDGMVWVSKPPQKLPPITNILRIFDVTSWVLILASMLSVSVVLLAVSKVGTLYGGKDQDYVDILLVSFR